ncbi:hypothetical protein Pelo_19076 [Pelomyxa schiedti]|nr:hypothetical protein Pelo_19076 [Pelomyxa schiedti]
MALTLQRLETRCPENPANQVQPQCTQTSSQLFLDLIETLAEKLWGIMFWLTVLLVTHIYYGPSVSIKELENGKLKCFIKKKQHT